MIIGGGHAATIAARALSKGAINAQAIAAVAPTWAGPLPIVFHPDSHPSNIKANKKKMKIKKQDVYHKKDNTTTRSS